jgi:DnaJ-domain-containing protein 1
VETASCEIGELLDLSPLGMRLSVPVRSAPKPGSVLAFRLRAPEGVVAVSGRVAWLKRVGLTRREIGVEFVQLSSPLKAALHALAEFGCLTATATDAADNRAEADSHSRGSAAASSGAHRAANAQRCDVSRIPVDMPDLYEMLGVAPDATDDDLHAAFRSLAKSLHPDVNREPEAAERFIMVNKAYEILSDPPMRAAYDLRRAA